MLSVQYGSLDHMVDNVVRFYSGHIQIHDENYWDEKVIDNSLTYDQALLDSLDRIENTVSVVPRVESFALSAYGTKTKGAMVLGIDPEKEKDIIDIASKVVNGHYFDSNDRSVLIGTGLAKYLDISVGDSIVLISQGFHGVSATDLYPVSGLVKFPNPDQNNMMVCMPLREAQWFYGLENRVSSLAILMSSQDDVKMAKKNIQSLTNDLPVTTMDWEEMMPELVQTVKLKHVSSNVFILILYLVIAFGMFGTFLMMTAERKREFGTTIAIGMRRSWLQLTVLYEIIMMSFIGVLAGVVMSLGIISYFHFNPIKLSSELEEMYESYGVEAVIEFAWSTDIFIWQAWAIFIIGFVLSFYPLLVLRRLRPVEAMRE